LIAQIVSSLGTLVLSTIVARHLGLAEFGRFTLLLAVLMTVVSLQTSWVGDALTVLDRSSAATRRGIDTTQWLFFVLGSVLGFGVVPIGGVGWRTSGALVLLIAAWQMEEYGRRALMARLEFGALAVNDAIYLVVAVTSMIGVNAAGLLTLSSVLYCMFSGACAAFVAAMFVLPPQDRLTIGPLSFADARVVARFGMWRSAQSGLGVFSALIIRVIVASMGSVAVLGVIEIGRLIAAPVFTLVAASSNALLPILVRARDDSMQGAWISRFVSIALATAIVGYGAIALLFIDGAGRAVAGSDVPITRVLLLGWLLQALVIGVTNPMFFRLVVVGRTQLVFWTKAVGAIVAIVFAWWTMECLDPDLIPLSLAVGATVSAILLQASRRSGLLRLTADD